MKTEVLLRNNYIVLPPDVNATVMDDVEQRKVALGTVLSNLAFYGYVPSKEAFNVLSAISIASLTDFWTQLLPALAEVSGSNRNMDKFVVYKNFPQEVLSKSQAEYWVAQVLMYLGLHNEYFTEDEKPREKIADKIKFKVLSLAPTGIFGEIFKSLVKNPCKWNDIQRLQMKFLVKELDVKKVDVDSFDFKINGILLANEVVGTDVVVKMSNATDVLRLAACMSDGDMSLRTTVKFKKFNRPTRRMFLSLLENSNNLLDDIVLRPEVWKRFLSVLHPNDYNFKNVSVAYDLLYRKDYETFTANVENKLRITDRSVLNLLVARPGDFMRRFHKAYALFGIEAVSSFISIVPKLSTIQILKISGYLKTINNRKGLIYPPSGNWNKAQFVPNKKIKIDGVSLDKLSKAFGDELSLRLAKKFPTGVNLGAGLSDIKLQTNDQELANYGRGTVFKIPKDVNFIRSASFWESKNNDGYNTWYDNSWNFFNEKWESVGASCWTSTNEFDGGAIFSGDPTNSKDLEGKACQMIDLYIDKLIQHDIRYAVWSVLAYSNVTFAKAKDVLATLQWGKDAEKGKLYEPSRAQMVFPIKGDNLTKYIAYIDVVERKVVYMDANLFGSIHDAKRNGGILSERMPKYVEYMESLPSVEDLFVHAPKGDTPILYSDDGINIAYGSPAYVFKPENDKNDFKKISLAGVLE